MNLARRFKAWLHDLTGPAEDDPYGPLDTHEAVNARRARVLVALDGDGAIWTADAPRRKLTPEMASIFAHDRNR